MSLTSFFGIFNRAVPPPPEAAAPADRVSGQRVLACLPAAAVPRVSAALNGEAAGLVVASTWSEALATMERLLPAVALVHASFEDASAVDLCSALRRLSGREGTAIVVVGAGGRDVRRALEAGATDVMRAPVDWELLGRRVRNLLDASRLRAELKRWQSDAETSRQLAAEACVQLERHKGLDPLTGLPTRRVLQGLIERSLGRSRGPGSAVALLLLDLDQFSEINETLGREGGDEALKVVAARLSDYLRSGEPELTPRPGLLLRATARLSGDEFAVVLTSVADPATLSVFAEGMMAALSTPARVKGTDVFLSASIGIAISSSGVDSSEALFQQAETALYDAKRRGRGNWRFYSHALEGATERKLWMDRLLRRAFERGEIRLHYQPVIDRNLRRITGAEALLRWPEPDLGWIPPTVFVPIAEETGLMTRIGDWVLHEACRELRSWIDGGLPPLRMAVNVSRCQLERGGLLASVRSALAETGVPPELVELELSERGVLRGDPEVLDQLREVKALGVRLLVDDFGTGDSSITYLRKFPIDGVKVDRSLISGLGDRTEDRAITGGIVAMARRLNLETIAEGVEETAQLDCLDGFDCGQVQGFLFSPAVAPEEFRSMVLAGRITGLAPSDAGV